MTTISDALASFPNASNFSSSTIESMDDLYKETATTRAVKMSLYAIVLFLSLVGNTLVCLVVCRQQRLRTSTNFFIVNLAVSDLGITVFCIPFDVIVQENKTWPFGDIMCRILYPIMTMCAFASVGTLTAISLNRYFAISRPMRFRAGTRRAKWSILAIWLISFLFVLPYIAHLELSKDKECLETWPNFYSKMYTIFIFIFQYIIPLTIITVAYTTIALQLRKNRMHLPASHRIQDRDVSKVVRMMTVVVTIFALCMLPNHILWLLRDFYDNFGKIGRELLAWGEILIYINSCTNPVVYSVCIEEFRLAFKLYITKCCRVSQDELKPITRMFERLSFRGRTASSTSAILERQFAKRARMAHDRESFNRMRRQNSGSVRNGNESLNLTVFYKERAESNEAAIKVMNEYSLSPIEELGKTELMTEV